MNYRTKLLLAFGVLVCLTVVLTGLSNWGGHKVQVHMERSRLAHDVLEGHLRLSSHTYQLFKQWADALLVGDQDQGSGEKALLEKLRADIASLRDMIAYEVAFVDEDEQEGEREELYTLSLIERQIDSETLLFEIFQITGFNTEGIESANEVDFSKGAFTDSIRGFYDRDQETR